MTFFALPVDAVGVRLGRVVGNADGGARGGAGAGALGNGGVGRGRGDNTDGYDGGTDETGVSVGFVLRLMPFDNVLTRYSRDRSTHAAFVRKQMARTSSLDQSSN